jgi:hypothetical protein
MIDTNKLSNELRCYLQLLVNLLFELPIENSKIKLTHDEVVYELNRDLLEYESSIGMHGSEFEHGNFSQYFFAYAKVNFDNFKSASILCFTYLFKFRNSHLNLMFFNGLGNIIGSQCFRFKVKLFRT